MRVVFYAHMAKRGNGGTESLLAVVTQLSIKHNCMVITPEFGSLNEELTKRNIKNKVLRFNWTSKPNNRLDFKLSKRNFNLIIHWLKSYRYNRLHVAAHVAALKSFHPDIVYTNTSVINSGFYVAKAFGVPHVWHIREFQYLDHKLSPDFGWWYFRFLLKKSSMVIVNSNILKDFYETMVSFNKISMVYNGIEIEKLKKRSNYGNPYTFLIVGILTENKGQRQAVLAAKKLHDQGYKFKLDIVGRGPLMQALQNIIEDFNMQDVVTLHGPSSNVSEFYQKADCYLMCSQTEAFGRVTVEAMLHQLPIICKLSEFNAAQEIVRENIDGIFYEQDTDLYLKMEYILNNKNLALKMGKEARERAKQNFSLAKSIHEIEQILETIK